MSFPAHESYVESGEEWIGPAPAHWVMTPLKSIADFVNGAAFKPSEWTEIGTPIIRIQNLNGGDDFNFYIGEVDPRHYVMYGDLLFGWSGNRGTSFGPFLWGREGLHYLNQHIFKVEDIRCDKQWLYWCLRGVTEYVEQEAHGIIGMVHVTKGRLTGVKVAMPNIREQRAIAAFLDRETAKIDALVAAQRRLIELLKEKRQAVISHAVTKGLDPSASMKDSGVEWLGQVPAHWEVAPLKHLAEIGNGSTPSRDNQAYWDGGDFPWLNSSVVNQTEVSASDQFVTELALKECHLPIVSPPAMLVGITGQGKTRGMATILSVEATINQHLAYVKPRDLRVDCGFLLRFFEANYEQLRAESEAGSTKGAITCQELASLKIPVPPAGELASIVSHLDLYCELSDRLAEEAQAAVVLLQERRAALISAAVTGKIDVRGMALAAEAA